LLDYLIIGHVTRDLDEASSRPGGTAAYAARTARELDCRVGVVTSAADDLDLRAALGSVRIARRLALHSTTFENIYADDGRQQVLHAAARRLGLESVPVGWRARLVHIAPVVHECAPGLVHGFPGAFIGVTPQGWMRTWDDAGHIHRRRWDEASLILPHVDAVVFSHEDVGGDEQLVREYAQQTRCLALRTPSASRPLAWRRSTRRERAMCLQPAFSGPCSVDTTLGRRRDLPTASRRNP